MYKTNEAPRSLTVEEFHKLILELEEPFKTMSQIAVCFGLRVSELLALQWRDVDWLNGKLRIERAIVMQNVDAVKTVASRQQMAIAPELLDVLKQWRQQTQFSADTDWIFASPVKIGRLPIRYCMVRQAIKGSGRADKNRYPWQSHYEAHIPELARCRGHSDCRAAAHDETHGHPNHDERVWRRSYRPRVSKRTRRSQVWL